MTPHDPHVPANSSWLNAAWGEEEGSAARFVFLYVSPCLSLAILGSDTFFSEILETFGSATRRVALTRSLRSSVYISIILNTAMCVGGT